MARGGARDMLYGTIFPTASARGAEATVDLAPPIPLD